MLAPPSAFPLTTPGAPANGPTLERVKRLDGLRALAFLAVFAHHALHLPLLWAGVDVFFVLSGYLITLGLLVRPRAGLLAGFYARRFLRIFPPYYLALAAVFALGDAPLRSAAWYVGYLSNFRDAFVAPSAPVLSPMWSLAVEEQFYLVWPLALVSIAATRRRALVLVAVLGAPLFRAVVGRYGLGHQAVYVLLPSRMDLLVVGAFFALERQRDPRALTAWRRAAPWAAGGAALLFAALAVLVPTFRVTANGLLFNVLGYELVLVVAVSIVVYLCERPAPWVARLLEARPLVYVGTISYTAYLVHSLVLHHTESLAVGRAPRVALGLAATLAIAAASWHLVEEPLQRLGRRRARSVGAAR